MASLAAASLLMGCSEVRGVLHDDGMGARRTHEYGQALAFDGHELWVRYDCGGTPLDVRFLGAFADATTMDGVIHRLALQRRTGERAKSWSGTDLVLSGGGRAPTLAIGQAQAQPCRIAGS